MIIKRAWVYGVLEEPPTEENFQAQEWYLTRDGDCIGPITFEELINHLKFDANRAKVYCESWVEKTRQRACDVAPVMGEVNKSKRKNLPPIPLD